MKEQTGEDLMRADAESLGLTWNEYCVKYGLVGPAQERRARRHELPLVEWTPNRE